MRQKKFNNKQSQSRSLFITKLMNQTGWSYSEVESSLKELEKYDLIRFPKFGGVLIKEETEVH